MSESFLTIEQIMQNNLIKSITKEHLGEIISFLRDYENDNSEKK